MKKLLTSAALAVAVSLSGASMAHAEVFFLTLADPTAGLTGSPFGEVDVLGEGTTAMDITVSLYGTNDFHWTNDPNHHALVFDLLGNPDVTISGLASPFTANGVQVAGADSASPFGSFDYDINFPKATGKKPPPMPLIQSFGFHLAGASNLWLDSTPSTYGNVFFATDIVQANGATGNVGALRTPPQIITTDAGGVPEPAAWTMMILGFGAAGTMLRRSRQLATATA